MKLRDFDYDIPKNLIAQEPLRRRDKARMMVIDRLKGKITHDEFSNIGHYLPEESSLVLNDSKVIPARLLAKRTNTGGQVEIFLLNRHHDRLTYDVLMRPTKRLKLDEVIRFSHNGLSARIIDKTNPKVIFNKRAVDPYLEKFGHIPLPPYIQRKDRSLDRKYYQTVFAKHKGSVAAPTAGLHFTNQLIQSLKRKRLFFKKVTLHINYATFKAVEEEDITKHHMYKEAYRVNVSTWKSLEKGKQNHKKVVAIGTTATRVLETVASTGKLKGTTDLYIYPGFKFKMVDILLTNFHLPMSSLLMLVYAFGSRKLMQRAYREAVLNKYRFYSYGDCMLIL